MMQIEPYRSVGPIRFGASANDVRVEVGEPLATSKDRRGNTVLRYEGLVVTLSNDRVVEVGLFPGAQVSVRGLEIFDPSAFETLCAWDGDPKECLGFVILLNLGLTMTGFHDGDVSQKAATAFSAGRWDVLKAQMKPFVAPTTGPVRD